MCRVDVDFEIIHQHLGESDNLSTKPVTVPNFVGVPIQGKSSLECLHNWILGKNAHATANHTTGITLTKRQLGLPDAHFPVRV